MRALSPDDTHSLITLTDIPCECKRRYDDANKLSATHNDDIAKMSSLVVGVIGVVNIYITLTTRGCRAAAAVAAGSPRHRSSRWRTASSAKLIIQQRRRRHASAHAMNIGNRHSTHSTRSRHGGVCALYSQYCPDDAQKSSYLSSSSSSAAARQATNLRFSRQSSAVTQSTHTRHDCECGKCN